MDLQAAAPQTTQPQSGATGILVAYACDTRADASCHERTTQYALARKLAALMAYEFGGEFNPAHAYSAPLYFVPDDTLVGIDLAHRLGINDNRQLFGGVVPYPFAATKMITHPLVAGGAQAPAGWSHGFGAQVAQAVLPGYSTFTADDARHAATTMLKQGAVRLKLASGRGGGGQMVIHDTAALELALGTIAASLSQDNGVVIERNLNQALTHSVGQVLVGSLLATYCGTQASTHDHCGREVYGGSRLTVVRGDFNALLALDLDAGTRTAVAQARAYHAAAVTSFPGMFASRCNYDVLQGIDDQGQWRSGVLEQSWRIGGASGAEIAALEAFHANPALAAVVATTTEIYQADPPLPGGAMVYCQQDDPVVGPIVKYARLEDYA